ncbi:MAG: zinc ribbon domain-containing protein [Oscillospiraceae bacterium]|nr:zinc ribbon domain-containing protein [Oscillospiraceae bacterium]
MKKCINCGTELPEEANICPACGKLQSEPEAVEALRPWKRKTLTWTLVILTLAAVILFSHFYHFPGTFLAEGPELLYSDKDGNYRIILSWSYRSGLEGTPQAEYGTQLGPGEESAQPSILFVYDLDSGELVKDRFLEKINNVEVRAETHGNAKKMGIFGPSASEDFPDAAFMADVVYKTECGTNDIVWKLEMNNGDTIVLQHSFTVDMISSVVYSAEEEKLETLDDLRALFEKIEANNSNEYVTVFLPAVTYEGDLELPDRGVELIGSTENGKQTTLHGHLTVKNRNIQMATIRNVTFEGRKGVGITSSTALELYQCVIREFETGVLAQDGGWIGIHDSLLENNQTGFCFDSTFSSMADKDYDGNRFLNNGTAISLRQVPGGNLMLEFPKTVFSGNETDIENIANNPVNLKTAVFK